MSVRVSVTCARTMQRLLRSKQLGLKHLMCPLVLLPLRELQPPPEKLPGEGLCFGVVVGLEGEDVLGPPGQVEDDSAGGAAGVRPPALPVKQMRATTRKMRGMVMKRMSTTMMRKASSMRKKRGS